MKKIKNFSAFFENNNNEYDIAIISFDLYQLKDMSDDGDDSILVRDVDYIGKAIINLSDLSEYYVIERENGPYIDFILQILPEVAEKVLGPGPYNLLTSKKIVEEISYRMGKDWNIYEPKVDLLMKELDSEDVDSEIDSDNPEFIAEIPLSIARKIYDLKGWDQKSLDSIRDLRDIGFF